MMNHRILEGPSQPPPPFSMQLKLLLLYSEVKSECFTIRCVPESIGNPGSLCVTRDITQVNYREHMRRSLRLKICWKMEIKIVETYYVASFCCP